MFKAIVGEVRWLMMCSSFVCVSLFFPKKGCGADGDAVHTGGGAAGVGGAVGAEHEGGHAAAVRPAEPLRRRRRAASLRGHAGGAAGGGAAAMEQDAVVLPAQDRLRPRQDPLPLRLLRHGKPLHLFLAVILLQ